MSLIVTVIGVLTVSFALGLSGPMTAQAATSPSLGDAATYGVLADTFNYNVGLTTITGVAGTSVLGYVGAFPGGGASLVVTGNTEVNNAARTTAGTAQNAALNNVVDGLNIQPCTSIGAIVALDAIDIDGAGPLPPGTFTPGCYSSTGTMNITTGTTVTLSGSGTYIFRPAGALNPAANSTIALVGASACDVFWAPIAATTIGANSTFVGTVIDAAGITIGNTVNWTGRALAYGGTVTADTDTITVPTCVVPPVPGGSVSYTGTINVVKLVVGGTKIVADFPLFINGTPAVSGTTYTLPAQSNMYTISETIDPNYTQTISGDCDSSGVTYLQPAEVLFCIVTNTFKTVPVVVPPLIDVIKVPSPLALPTGSGAVTYTYTLTNIGTVPVSNVTMVGDTCSPITLSSGDVNSDAKLDLTETWIYKCSTTLTETHTNNVVATGWANGISATDVASATVVVGSPTVPPLIHVTKVPNPLSLLAKGGMVTYTEKITNPGTVALSNVKLTDDKCSPMAYISGDTNGDSKLDTTETWTYTCRTNLTKTTTNVAIASGEANGLTVRDLATATVVVAALVPALPNTGYNPVGAYLAVFIVLAIGILAVLNYFFFARKKQTR